MITYDLTYSIAGLAVAVFALAIAIMIYSGKRDAKSSKKPSKP